MNGQDEHVDEPAQRDEEEEEEERRQHLADILERASAIHYSSPEAVTPNNGLNMNASRPTGNGFLRRERRDARTRLRRALLASSLGMPRQRTNAAQHVPIEQDGPQNEQELTLADLDRALNATYDYRYRPNMTADAGNAGHVDNNDEPHYTGHYSAPQLTTTSSLLMDTDEDDDGDDQTNSTNAAAQAGHGRGMTDDRARLRIMLLRGLAVPSTSLDISMGHSSDGGNNDFHHRSQNSHQQNQQHPPPHHVDATISLRTAIQRAHHDLVVLDDEFRGGPVPTRRRGRQRAAVRHGRGGTGRGTIIPS